MAQLTVVDIAFEFPRNSAFRNLVEQRYGTKNLVGLTHEIAPSELQSQRPRDLLKPPILGMTESPDPPPKKNVVAKKSDKNTAEILRALKRPEVRAEFDEHAKLVKAEISRSEFNIYILNQSLDEKEKRFKGFGVSAAAATILIGYLTGIAVKETPPLNTLITKADPIEENVEKSAVILSIKGIVKTKDLDGRLQVRSTPDKNDPENILGLISNSRYVEVISVHGEMYKINGKVLGEEFEEVDCYVSKDFISIVSIPSINSKG